jgi:uncharacterized membrane protein
VKRELFFLLACVFLVGPVSAQTYINIYLDESGNAIFLGITEAEAEFPEGISVNNGRITGQTSALTSKNGPLWAFEYFLEGSELRIIFPERASIKSIAGGEIYLEKGRINAYALNGTRIEYTIDKRAEKRLSGFILVGIISALIIGAFSIYLKTRGGKIFPKGRGDRISEISHILNQRERTILDNLKSTGKIKSSYLRKKCDIPKASFSRHIRELDKKSLVKISGEGKNKFIELNL